MTLNRITPQTCLLASMNWLGNEMGMYAERGLVVRNNGTWLELWNLSSDGDLEGDDLEPVLRSLISRHEVADTDTLTTSDMLLIDFHASNPTPIVQQMGGGLSTCISSPSPWLKLAIISTTRGVEARTYSTADAIWGVNVVWPF